MFVPNASCILRRRATKPDRRGEFAYGRPHAVPCAIVKLAPQHEKTSVRADSSASRGQAEEEVADARLLFPTYVPIKAGDIVEADGLVIEATGRFPRRDVLGNLDHYDVTFRVSQLP